MKTVVEGRSAFKRSLKVGEDAPPRAGPENMVLAVWVAKVPVRVPEVVMGEPVMLNIEGRDSETDVTVPVPPPPPTALHTPEE